MDTFNSTCHTRLLHKRIQMLMAGELMKVIDFYLAHRSFRVKMDRAASGWGSILEGVPQGSTLFTIYNMHISNISKYISTELAVYADDICLYDRHKISRFLHLAVSGNLYEVCFSISVEKTKAVIFAVRRWLQLPAVRLYESLIDYVP